MTTTSAEPVAQRGGARVAVQRFGTFLSGMIMPNIAAFIAWGIITALFIPTGWLPNETLAALVGPMLAYLIPLLIAFTGGRMVYGNRGGVIGAIAAMGVIVGGDGNIMILGAMVAGPLAALILKQIERLWTGKVRPGFEMLVDNFSAGIIGFFLALAAFFGLTPIINWVTNLFGGAVGFLIDNGLLPLASIIVEPAKVLFLNNAINHGVFTPLGVEQVAETGKSILFLIEANPGPGAGLLLAISIFGVGAARATAPGAFIIQFFGGIHEVYFPYVLAKPILILGLIAGGASGVLTNVIGNGGLIAPASPGSIIAIMGGALAAQTALTVALSVIISAAVTFGVTMLLLLASRKRDLAASDAAFQDAITKTEENKGKKSDLLGAMAGRTASGGIHNVVFACDAGMGSSAMGASVLRKKLSKAGVEGVTVTNKAIANLDGTEDLVITHQDLTDRARQQTPGSIHVSVDNFMNSPKYDEVVEQVAAQSEQPAK
ncbi:PTS system mannitol-specific IIC component [Microbacteriaceae bacterium SG_E_30_P1]|uniref:PTS system mannitol-specific EIICB component n=1 Tax=Antiquaquibacter oligotrophicus TaxID=2880260 RepID=A0ABT6KP45_9MICO|nr:PTS mannitol transporter subunit IICB [Antiquaquibacter oligotrophicus]MDH6181770.1 PTS system mannitol-specific IIC component [Antiquaquibacter oligotrophicus]UDF12549.1 PTS mannitol transporter subunit IICB [Antiquaquibacter oligotrophicus]